MSRHRAIEPGLGLALGLAALGLATLGCEAQVVQVDCVANPAACATSNSISSQPPRLAIEPPFGLGFACVTLGCDEERTLKVSNRGGGSLKVSVVRLTAGASADFALSVKPSTVVGNKVNAPAGLPSTDQPLDLGPGEFVTVAVRYTPRDAVADQATLRLDWFDGGRGADGDIKQVTLPVATRVLADAAGKLSSDEVNFGYVALGTEAVVNIEVENTSGDAMLALGDAKLGDDSANAFSIDAGFVPMANPGERILIPVRFAPLAADAFFGTVELALNDPNAPTRTIVVRGTSIREPRLVVTTPALGGVDFGAVRFGEAVTRVVSVRNIGGTDADLSATLQSGSDPDLRLEVASGDLGPINAMQEVRFNVQLAASHGGDVKGQLSVLAVGKGGSSTVTLGLAGFGDAPVLVTTPATVDFGTLAHGWVAPVQRIKLVNSGTGDLVISAIEFEIGSSLLIRMSAMPALPYVLRPGDESYGIPVFMSADTLGVATATLLIQSNAIGAPLTRIAVQGNVLACADACPTAHGTPSCASGACAIAMCAPGWHNTNTSLSDGCECQDERVGLDIGGTCSSGDTSVGTLGDGCSNYPNEAYRTANLAEKSDVDVYFFRTEDASGVFCDTFGDSSETRVELVSAPPGVALCVRVGAPDDVCGGYTSAFDAQYCGQSAYVTPSSWGSNDSHTVTVWVLWRPEAQPVCGNYTVKFRGKKY